MPKPSPRNFTLTDSLILIAATALAMALTRHSWADHVENFWPGGEAHKDNWQGFRYQLWYLTYDISYFPALWTLACLILGLRQPRTAWKFCFRRPGMAACLTALIVLGLRIMSVAVYITLEPFERPETDLIERLQEFSTLPQIPSEIGGAIIATWVLQAACGRWRPEPSWIDRFGRALGFYWIATIPIGSSSWI